MKTTAEIVEHINCLIDDLERLGLGVLEAPYDGTAYELEGLLVWIGAPRDRARTKHPHWKTKSLDKQHTTGKV